MAPYPVTAATRTPTKADAGTPPSSANFHSSKKPAAATAGIPSRYPAVNKASMSDPVSLTKTTVPYRSRNDPPVHPVTMHNDTLQPDRTYP